MTLKFYFTFLLFLSLFNYSFSQGQVSQNITQVLSVEEFDRDNPPKSIYVKLNSKNVEVKHMRGSRVMVNGIVKLGIPNLFFLDVLIKKGRYQLNVSPDGQGIRIEDKVRQPMVLQGNTCSEEVSYVIYVPSSIKSVVFENPITGDSNATALSSDGAKFKSKSNN